MTAVKVKPEGVIMQRRHTRTEPQRTRAAKPKTSTTHSAAHTRDATGAFRAKWQKVGHRVLYTTHNVVYSWLCAYYTDLLWIVCADCCSSL